MPSSKSVILRIFICLELIFLVNASYSDGRHRFCGNHLRKTLSLFCNGEYEQMPSQAKRSGEDLEDYAYLNDQQSALEEIPINYQSLPYLGKFGNALRPRIRRQSQDEPWVMQRGIIDECCRKPCTYTQLKSYCKSSDDDQYNVYKL